VEVFFIENERYNCSGIIRTNFTQTRSFGSSATGYLRIVKEKEKKSESGISKYKKKPLTNALPF